MRSMGLDARIQTFQAKRGADGAGSDALYARLIDWVWRYFKGEGLSDGAAVERTDRPPLYFQHHGHSRTIIGVERRGVGAGRKEFLLVSSLTGPLPSRGPGPSYNPPPCPIAECAKRTECAPLARC